MALQKGYNSFVTITEAEGYFYDRLNQASWDSATDETVERALVTATGILDNLDWGGTAVPTTLYPLSWPRDITYWDTIHSFHHHNIFMTMVPVNLRNN